MKADIHPTWFPEAQVVCACGNTFTVGSTRPSISVEICAKCHPFFTGEMRFVDTLGRVEKFQQKQQATNVKAVSKKMKKVLKKKQEEEEEAKRPKSLKEMLDKVKTKE